MISSGQGGMILPDTHAHLDASVFAADLEAVIERAVTNGVTPILTVGEDLESSRRAVEIAGNYAPVFAAVGLHPHRADRFEEEEEGLKRLLHAQKVVAIGEIGLDAARSPVTAEQGRAFEAQLAWAREYGLPVSIHSRGAEEEVLALLHDGDRAILHCFGGSVDLAARAVAKGCVISFAGNVTFPKAEVLRQAARVVPSQNLLVESDAPVLAPQPRRGKTNEPSYVRMTAEALAALRGDTLDCLASHVSANAHRILGWAA